MKLLYSLGLIAAGLTGAVQAEEYALKEIQTAPEKVTQAIAGQLEAGGVEVTSDGKIYCRIWLRKAVAVQADFTPSLMVKYPFKSGELLGVLEVPTAGLVKDFRGQELKAGTYTLRFGLQPADGNHIGTSETSDFILALPAGEEDKSPEAIQSEDDLFNGSAKSVGATHPAIFALQSAEKAPEKTTLIHDEDHEFQLLHGALTSSDKKTVPFKLVIVGQSEG